MCQDSSSHFPYCWSPGPYCLSLREVFESKCILRSHSIDPSTDTAAIVNLLDLRSIMGCPGGTCSVFMGAFRAKKRTSRYFSREKGGHDYIQTRHNDLFFSLQSFFRKRKIGPKSARKY